MQGLFNEYGPTEATVWASVARVDENCATIGKPILNTQLYVLDAALQPVPVGVSGDLSHRWRRPGAGLLNRPALTAERFVANPFGEPGSRLCHTGDLVRWLPDGNLDFLGQNSITR